MSIKTKVAKRRVVVGVAALALLTAPSAAVVANATTVTDRDKGKDTRIELSRVLDVPYSTVIVEDPKLPVDVEVLKTEGTPGLKHVYTTKGYSDAEGPLLEEVVVEQPVDRVILRGTNFELPKATAPEPEPEPVAAAASAASEESSVSAASNAPATQAPAASESTVSRSDSGAATSAQYSLNDLMFNGVINWNGLKFTYYSQGVLPGGGLSIPGRHVNDGGYVADGDGYIVLAAPPGISHGTVYSTPFGYSGKVYDTCATCSTSPMWLDVYTR